MLTIRLNGEERTLPSPQTIAEILQEFKIPSQSIAVAINSEIVPRSFFEKTRVKNRDEIEIIHPVGGG